MANLISYARPYAVAAFDYARANNELPAWKAFFDFAAIIAEQSKVVALLNNPTIHSDKTFTLFSDVMGSLLNDHQKNFLSLLAQNKRLVFLPTIAADFNTRFRAHEKRVQVQLITAIPVSDDYKEKLKPILKARINQEIILDCEVNPAILGGAIIHIGDRVIDGSIRGKLTRLLENLTS
jgi:F-type H+-transporting ATPase subunit delta